MKYFLLTFLLISSVAYSADKTTLQIFEELADSADVHNGGSNVSKYKMPFDMKRELKLIKKAYNTESNCKFNYTIGRRQAVKDIQTENIADNKTAEELNKLIKAKKIKTIISAQWNGESGDSEYCSIYDFWIYDNNGNKLSLEYNFTD